MNIILLERVGKLGAMGDEVTVKSGFARNFLLPMKKALLATDANRAHFQKQRSALEAVAAKARGEAEKIVEKIGKVQLVLIRQAADTGQLFGSVSARDITEALNAQGHAINRGQVVITQPFKAVGIYTAELRLHADVIHTIEINIARTLDESKAQAKSGVKGASGVIADISAEEQAVIDASAFFEAPVALDDAEPETVTA